MKSRITKQKLLTVEKPWGKERWFAHTSDYAGKIIYIKKGHRLSLQYHNNRKEFWKLIEGEAIFQIGDQIVDAKENDEYYIESKMLHRITGKDKIAKVLEISVGTFDEKDIVRIEDDYGRVN